MIERNFTGDPHYNAWGLLMQKPRYFKISQIQIFVIHLWAVLWIRIRNNPNVLAGSESESEQKVRIRIRIRIQTLL
jgi:hypothetical protein